MKIQPIILTTIPDSTSQKFILLGALGRKEQTEEKRYAMIHLDFAGMRTNKCRPEDLEKWYARGRGKHECIMGHKVS